MSRRRFVLYSLAAAIILVVAGFVITYNSSKAKYDIFLNHRELFEAVRDESEQLMDKLDNRSDIGNTFLYSVNGNAAAHQFHDSVNANLQAQIRKIAAMTEDKLNFLRYSRLNGKSFLRFVFDWEAEYGNTYHIVYCESRDVVERAYQEEPVKYVLRDLDDGWYGIEIKR